MAFMAAILPAIMAVGHGAAAAGASAAGAAGGAAAGAAGAAGGAAAGAAGTGTAAGAGLAGAGAGAAGAGTSAGAGLAGAGAAGTAAGSAGAAMPAVGSAADPALMGANSVPATSSGGGMMGSMLGKLPKMPKSFEPPGGMKGQISGGVSSLIGAAKGNPGPNGEQPVESVQNPIAPSPSFPGGDSAMPQALMPGSMDAPFGASGRRALSDTLLRNGG